MESPTLQILTGQNPEPPAVGDPALSTGWDRTISGNAFQPQPSQDSVIYFFFQEIEMDVFLVRLIYRKGTENSISFSYCKIVVR